jgi:hypothetical protein
MMSHAETDMSAPRVKGRSVAEHDKIPDIGNIRLECLLKGSL